jgi:DNA-directed RNA polymerase
LVKCINEILYINYPKIKALTEYLSEIGKICNKLNIPIIWRLPHGLNISQKYLVRKTKKIEPFKYSNSSISLTITDKLQIDKRKQISALMPNLVHSLDSSTLALLYISFYNTIKDIAPINFYSVHDCYGVSAKQVKTLITLLKTVYIDIYSNESYILNFDKDIIHNITSILNGEYNHDKRVITYAKRKKISLPEISSLITSVDKQKHYDSLLKSLYLIK